MKSIKKLLKLYKERRMKMKLKCEGSKNSSDKSESLRKYLSKEQRDLIQLKQVVMVSWKRCQLLSSEKE